MIKLQNYKNGEIFKLDSGKYLVKINGQEYTGHTIAEAVYQVPAESEVKVEEPKKKPRKKAKKN